MPVWSDIATWRGPSPNTSGQIADHMYVIIHTADGSFEGTIAWQKNSTANVSSHFIVAKDGRIAQMLDTNAKPWTQISGNPYSISIENEGNEHTPLTPQQIEANARILAKAHQVHGVPLQLTGHVGTRGLGHHSMGAESGVNWGHSQCPGSIIKGQKAAILARAAQLVGSAPVTPTPESSGGTNMPDVNLSWGETLSAYIHRIEPMWISAVNAAGQHTALLTAIAKAQGVAQADLDDIQARVGGFTVSDAQIPLLAKALGLTPDVLTAAARKAIDGRLDDNPAT